MPPLSQLTAISNLSKLLLSHHLIINQLNPSNFFNAVITIVQRCLSSLSSKQDSIIVKKLFSIFKPFSERLLLNSFLKLINDNSKDEILNLAILYFMMLNRYLTLEI